MKRKQLQKDIVQIKEWIAKVEKEIEDRVNGNVEATDEYLDVRIIMSQLFIVSVVISQW